MENERWRWVGSQVLAALDPKKHGTESYLSLPSAPGGGISSAGLALKVSVLGFFFTFFFFLRTAAWTAFMPSMSSL